jgi:hypothetical protein
MLAHMTDEKPGTESPAAPPLTSGQQRFVREYTRTGSAKKSAVLAGFSPRSAKQIGHSLLKKRQVRQAIEALRESRTPNKSNLTAEEALRMLVEETADPNPRVRLDAKKAVAQAVGLFTLQGQKQRADGNCSSCARLAALEALPDEDLELRVAGTSRERVTAMSEGDFERWVSSLRAETERRVLIARGIRRKGVGAADSAPIPVAAPATPDGTSGPAPASR